MFKGCLVSIGVFFALIFAVIVVGIFKYSLGTESGSWNYKVTVTVATPEGDVTGSAVRNISNTVHPRWADLTPEMLHTPDIKGEAVVVDLGERGLFFTLLDDHDDERLHKIFTDGSFTSPQGLKKFKETLTIGKKGQLGPEFAPGYPPVVTFKDLDDPTSLVVLMKWKRLDPVIGGRFFALEENRFPEIFGEGVHLKSIEYEITEEPVTDIIVPLIQRFGYGSGPYSGSMFHKNF